MIQSWGSRLLTFLIFLVISRLCSPAEIGLASAVSLVILLLGVIAEFGFTEALIQRPDLERHHVMLPFVQSMLTACILALALFLCAPLVEAGMNQPGLAPLLKLAAVALPVTTASAFQEAMYKRAFAYKQLALRTFFATLISGAAGIVVALARGGAASLVVQALVLNTAGAIWLWTHPIWLPQKRFDRASGRQMMGYSVNVLASRLLDFLSTRVIDLLILTLYGTAILGLYTVGSRIYLTVMQLLTSAVTDVSLSALSRMVSDRERMASTYLSSIGLSSLIASPIFVAIACLAPEITVLLFGERWAESAAVMTPLMLLGAIQTVQFVNGAYFGAMGRPGYVVWLTIIKVALVLAALAAFPSNDVGELSRVFVLAQFAVSPLTFLMALRLLNLTWKQLWEAIGRTLVCVLAAYLVPEYAVRPWLAAQHLGIWSRLFMLGTAFVVIYGCCVVALARPQLGSALQLAATLTNRSGRNKPALAIDPSDHLG